MEKNYLTLKEKICFPLSAFGRSGIYTIMTMFYLVFLVDVAKLNAVTASAIILGGRIFDALNDPIMGMIVDKTRSKWGKMRPYLLFSPIPVCVSTILLFIAPFQSSAAATVYAACTYVLWGVCFTIQDVPFWGLTSVITPNEKERTQFISNGRLGSTFGGILPALLIPILRQSSLGLRGGYLFGAILFGVMGALLSSLAFFTTKERIEPSTTTPTFKETVHVVGQNKLLLLVIAAAILGSTMVIANISADYIANYLIIQGYTDFDVLASTNDVVEAYKAGGFWIPRGTILTTLTVAIGAGMVPAMVVFPMLRKKFDLKQIYIGSSIFGVIAHCVCYFLFMNDPGHINIYILWVCLFLMGFPLGIYNVITYAFIADSVDYMQWKTGKRSEGVCFAFQTFLSKVTAGIAGVVTGWVLEIGKYQKPIDGNLDINGKQILAQQTPFTQKWLLIMVTLLPALGFLLTMIPMFFNDYTGKKKEKIQNELEEIRKKEHELSSAVKD